VGCSVAPLVRLQHSALPLRELAIVGIQLGALISTWPNVPPKRLGAMGRADAR
jgi:hypothetical protein